MSQIKNMGHKIKSKPDVGGSVRRVAPYSHWVGVLYGLTDGELNSE